MFIISASRPLFDYLALIVFSPLTAILYLCSWSQIERCCITLITQINYYRYLSLHSNSFLPWTTSLLPFSSHLFSCLSFSSSPFSSSLSSQHSSSSWPVRTSGRGTYSLLARLVVVVVRLLILWDWGNKILCKIKSWLDEHQPGHRVEGGADIHCCLLLAPRTAKRHISVCWRQLFFSLSRYGTNDRRMSKRNFSPVSRWTSLENTKAWLVYPLQMGPKMLAMWRWAKKVKVPCEQNFAYNVVYHLTRRILRQWISC